MLDQLKWKPHPEVPRHWLMAQYEIAPSRWLLAFKRPDNYNEGAGYSISLNTAQWPAYKNPLFAQLEHCRTDELLIANAVVRDLIERYGDGHPVEAVGAEP